MKYLIAAKKKKLIVKIRPNSDQGELLSKITMPCIIKVHNPQQRKAAEAREGSFEQKSLKN